MNPANSKIAAKMRKELVRLFPHCFAPRGKPKKPLAYNLIENIAARAAMRGDVVVRSTGKPLSTPRMQR